MPIQNQKRVVAAAVKAAWNSSNEPNVASIAAASSADGAVFQESSIPRKSVVQVSATIVNNRLTDISWD